MEEVSFYRDAMKSYMVIRCPEGTAGEGYQYKMLAANHIEGLLNCSFRNIDADSYLYYDITSRQKLTVLFSSRKLSAADVRRILQDVIAVRQSLADYLLDASRVLLDPEYIFCDLCDASCAFTYYPENTDERGLRSLLAFMSSHVDERDSEAAGIIYRLLSMAENDGFRFDREVLNGILNVYEPKSDPCYREIPPEQKKVEFEGYQEEKEAAAETDPPVPETTGKAWQAVGILCVAAGVILYGILDFYPEWIADTSAATLCRAGIFIFPIIGAVILAAGRVRKKRKKQEAGGSQKREQQSAQEDVQQDYVFPSAYPEAFRAQREKDSFPYDGEMAQTTVLGYQTPTMGKLYGTGRAAGMQISLDQLPCTIGKMREYAGIVLNDSTVSRIHASLSTGEDGQIYIKDLNSTNGTDVNGVRLSPDASCVIRQGDEIRIGGLSFVYR